MLASTAWPISACKRQRAHYERDGSHDDWTESQTSCLGCSLYQGTALVFVEVFCELDDQDGVLRRKPHGRQHADLEEHVVRKTSTQRCSDRTKHSQRHDEHDRYWYRPALIQSCKAEEYDHQ
ncbi:hypothetical protein D3C77_447700 [compost metagenome]